MYFGVGSWTTTGLTLFMFVCLHLNGVHVLCCIQLVCEILPCEKPRGDPEGLKGYKPTINNNNVECEYNFMLLMI